MIRSIARGLTSPVVRQLAPMPPPNLIFNPELAGGYPPTGYQLIFNTTQGRMIDNGDGTFKYESNFDQISGRNVLTWSLADVTLTPGIRYRLEYTCQKLNATGYSAALRLSNTVNVTVHSSDTTAREFITKRIWVEFTPEAGYDGNVRIGCGTTTDNTAHLIYSTPRIIELPY